MKREMRDGGPTIGDTGGFEFGEGPLVEPVAGRLTEYPLFDEPGLRRFADMSLTEIAKAGGLRRVDVVAWRDFDDPEAGGSELHAHRILTAWADAGLPA